MLTTIHRKLAVLADAAKYDASCASSGSQRSNRGRGLGDTQKIGICHSYTPDGRCISLLKILLTNYCIYDCKYCVNRVSSDVPRARFSPDEVAWLTVEFYKRNYIEGLFLSSGIIQNPDYTMEQVIAVAKSLRSEHQFHGYIHLKTAAGASAELIAEAGRWADRLSVNVELPTQGDLEQLAPEKSLETIEVSMRQIRQRIDESRAARAESRLAPTFAPAGQSTQMIIGATPAADGAILETASRLYRVQRLRRVYYSAFSPIPRGDGRLPAVAPPLIREHRLYQADWLMRFYGFAAAELTESPDANLDLAIDPKLAWALRNPAAFPVDVNRAPRESLLRVPGLGARNVSRLLSLRRDHRVTRADLGRLRVSLRKAGRFIVTHDSDRRAGCLDDADWRRSLVPARQLSLFDAVESAATGQL